MRISTCTPIDRTSKQHLALGRDRNFYFSGERSEDEGKVIGRGEVVSRYKLTYHEVQSPFEYRSS